MKVWRVGVFAAVLCSLASCRSLPGPEEMTDDGLVRVASRASGGVFRKPDAQFVQYKRIILEPPVIAFKKGWRDQHKEVSDGDVKRLRDMASELFREEFERALVTDGSWTFAETPDPDVIIIEPRIVDLDVLAPNAGNEAGGVKTMTPGPVKMEIIGEVRDAQTGVIVGRVDMFDGNEPYGIGTNELRVATRITNLHEMRMAFKKWSRLLRESLDVAKATRPHRSAPEAGGNLKTEKPAEKPES